MPTDPPQFPTALRGYDRDAVNRHVTQLHGALGEIRDRLGALERAHADVRRSMQQQVLAADQALQRERERGAEQTRLVEQLQAAARTAARAGASGSVLLDAGPHVPVGGLEPPSRRPGRPVPGPRGTAEGTGAALTGPAAPASRASAVPSAAPTATAATPATAADAPTASRDPAPPLPPADRGLRPAGWGRSASRPAPPPRSDPPGHPARMPRPGRPDVRYGDGAAAPTGRAGLPRPGPRRVPALPPAPDTRARAAGIGSRPRRRRRVLGVLAALAALAVLVVLLFAQRAERRQDELRQSLALPAGSPPVASAAATASG